MFAEVAYNLPMLWNVGARCMIITTLEFMLLGVRLVIVRVVKGRHCKYGRLKKIRAVMLIAIDVTLLVTPLVFVIGGKTPATDLYQYGLLYTK